MVRYGPFSDGEADRVAKRPVGPTTSARGGRGRARRQSTSSFSGMSNNVVGVGVDFPPHYVTLSKATLDQVTTYLLRWLIIFSELDIKLIGRASIATVTL